MSRPQQSKRERTIKHHERYSDRPPKEMSANRYLIICNCGHLHDKELGCMTCSCVVYVPRYKGLS